MAVREGFTIERRRQAARDFAQSAGLTMPILLDDMENSAFLAYHVFQSAYFVIGADGKVAFRSGMPPRGLNVEGVAPVLKALCSTPARQSGQDSHKPEANL